VHMCGKCREISLGMVEYNAGVSLCVCLGP